jgi:YHS domain-containing protein
MSAQAGGGIPPVKKTELPLPHKHRNQFVTLCGRVFRDTDPAYFPRAEYKGRTIYFCTDSCLGAFLADPDLFYKVHRNSEKGK